jgi:hypothetical protein
MKYAAYFNTEIAILDQLSISPRVLYLQQGASQELNIGASVRFGSDQFYKSGFHLGGFLRPVRDEDKYTLDALIILAGVEYNNILLGLSYDLSLRDLVNDRQGIGIFEFSISYIGEYENEFTFCPQF